jgi:type II secretory pathway pseudopilin PulG
MRGDAGITLVELLVAMALLALIVPLTFPMLTDTLKVGGRLASQSSALDQLHLAAASVGRDARAATCLKLGLASPPPAGTDARAATLVLLVDRAGTPVTVTYDDTGDRLTRSEDGGTPVTVAGGLTGDPMIFTLHPGGHQALVLDLAASVEGADPVTLHVTVTPRAAWQSC